MQRQVLGARDEDLSLSEAGAATQHDRPCSCRMPVPREVGAIANRRLRVARPAGSGGKPSTRSTTLCSG